MAKEKFKQIRVSDEELELIDRLLTLTGENFTELTLRLIKNEANERGIKMEKTKVRTIFNEIKKFIKESELFDKFNKSYEFETEEEAEELECKLVDLNDNNITTNLIDNILVVSYQNLDETGRYMEMFYKNFKNETVNGLRAIHNALDRLNKEDIKHYLKKENFYIQDEVSYDFEAKDYNRTVNDEEDKMKLFDELEEGFNGSNDDTFVDKENGYIVMFIH